VSHSSRNLRIPNRESAKRAPGIRQSWGSGALAALTQALLDDPAAMVGRQAVLEPATIGGDEAIVLLEQATQDPDGGVRRLAERNLSFLEGQRDGGGL